MVLPEFIESFITSNIEKTMCRVKTYAFLRELYSLNEVFEGKYSLNMLNPYGCLDYEKLRDNGKTLFKHISFSFGDKNSNDYTKKNNYIVDAICKFDKFGDLAMFDINEITSSNLVVKTSLNYKTQYDAYINSIKQDDDLHITPHIDKQWHEILPEIK